MPQEKDGVVYHLGKNVRLGRGVKIWHFAYVGDGAEIGDNVAIGSLAHIDYKTFVGSGTRISGMVYIPPLSVIGQNVFIGPAAVLTNDRYPMSKRLEGVTIEDGAVICARSVIGSGLRVGKKSVVAMGSVVTKNVPPETVVMGMPARPVYSRADYDKKKDEWEGRR
jgi:UDP-2-acetamido-3-amino-2,3-dideoxy-glucuronate N-acetyltransferase